MVRFLLFALYCLWTLTVLASPGFDELLSQDPWFEYEKISLENHDFSRHSLEFIQKEGLESRAQQLLSKDSKQMQMNDQADRWIRNDTPLGILPWAMENGSDLWFVFGEDKELCYYLAKQGIKTAWRIRGVEKKEALFYLCTDEKDRSILVLGGFRDEYSWIRTQVWIGNLLARRGLKNRILLFDFHQLEREEYRSAPFKETFHILPVDMQTVVLGSGREIFSRVMERGFSKSTLLVLQGIYGEKFLNPLKRALIEEGFLGVSDWEVSRFAVLEGENSLLKANEYQKFRIFEKELLLILRQKESHQLSKLLVRGNRLVINKDGGLQSEIKNRLIFARPTDSTREIFAARLPVICNSQPQRILVVDDVHADAMGSLTRVLTQRGISRFVYAAPLIQGKSKSVVLAKSLSVSGKTWHIPAFETLYRGVSENFECSFFDLGLEGNKLLFSESACEMAKNLGSAKAFVLGATPLQNLDFEAKDMEYEKLVDILFEVLSLQDVLIHASEKEFGYRDMEHKISQFFHLHALEEDTSVMYSQALRMWLSSHLQTKEVLEAWLKQDSMFVQEVSHNDPFVPFLTHPYRDEEVISHITQIQEALNELAHFLLLMGEKDAKIRIYADFNKGSITPLTPLAYGLENISQASFFELSQSPFFGREKSQRTLLYLIPSGSRTDGSELYEFKSGFDLNAVFLAGLKSRGIFPRKEGGFVASEKKLKDKILDSYLRWRQGVDLFLKFARQDFLREKSRVFSLKWSDKGDFSLDKNVQNAVSALCTEGLEIKRMAVEDKKEDIAGKLDRDISWLEEFVRIFAK